MVNATDEFAATLKSARKKKGLSQRAFSRLAGMPQSRLSRIENGSIDIRTSSLIELARTLDLELMLIPRQFVPAVRSLTRGLDYSKENGEGIPMYTLDDEGDDGS